MHQLRQLFYLLRNGHWRKVIRSTEAGYHPGLLCGLRHMQCCVPKGSSQARKPVIRGSFSVMLPAQAVFTCSIPFTTFSILWHSFALDHIGWFDTLFGRALHLDFVHFTGFCYSSKLAVLRNYNRLDRTFISVFFRKTDVNELVILYFCNDGVCRHLAGSLVLILDFCTIIAIRRTFFTGGKQKDHWEDSQARYLHFGYCIHSLRINQ